MAKSPQIPHTPSVRNTSVSQALLSNVVDAQKNERIAASIETIRIHSHKLNEITDEAARIVQSVEVFLNEECSVGIESAVVFLDLDPVGPACVMLAYKRIGSKFRIAINWINDRNDIEESKAWSDCSRDIKLQSFVLLPELLFKIAESVKDKVQQISSTVHRVSTTLQGISGNQSSDNPIPF